MSAPPERRTVADGAARSQRIFQLLLLTLATFAATYSRAALGPLQETMRIALDLSDNEVAWLQGPAAAIPMALGSIPVGLLVDRCSRARLFVVFVTLGIAGTVLTALASSFVLLFLARCLTGLASAAILVTSLSVLADLYAAPQRGRATMVTLFGEIGGTPAAFALGGVLLGAAGTTGIPGLDSWRSSLLWMSVLLLPIVLALLLVREPARTDSSHASTRLRSVWPELWRYRAVIIPLLLARVMVWIADGAVLVWAAPAFARNFGLSPERIGAVMAMALLVSGLAGPMLGGPIADICQRRDGPRRTVSVMCAIAVASVPTAGFAMLSDDSWSALSLGTFLTLGFTIGTAALAVATIVIPGELRGLYLAITVTVGATFSIGVAPLLVSSLSGVLGGPAHIGDALTIICASSSILGAVAFGLGARYFPGGQRSRASGQCSERRWST